ncbi:MAG: DsbA family oxidoreductase [Trebonia sp.]
MAVIVYGDFNCPYSYLASQRADQLGRAGVTVDWRAVEHDPSLPATGSRADGEKDAWDREIAEVAALALPGELVPVLPSVITHTEAAVAAYAEAVSDGLSDELRHSLFRAIWVQGLHLSSPYEVRRLVTGLTWPQEGVAERLTNPDFPGTVLRDPDMTRSVRREGGTIALNGVPLTMTGWRRVRQWRQEWLALPSQVVPTVIGADEIVRPGIEGLRYLAELVTSATQLTALPVQAVPGPPQGTEHAPAVTAAR